MNEWKKEVKMKEKLKKDNLNQAKKQIVSMVKI